MKIGPSLGQSLTGKKYGGRENMSSGEEILQTVKMLLSVEATNDRYKKVKATLMDLAYSDLDGGQNGDCRAFIF